MPKATAAARLARTVEIFGEFVGSLTVYQIIDCRHLSSWHCSQMTDYVVKIGIIDLREYPIKVKKLTPSRC